MYGQPASSRFSAVAPDCAQLIYIMNASTYAPIAYVAGLYTNEDVLQPLYLKGDL